MKLFHASQVKDIEILEPRISNHGIPRIYFSSKRENVLVYLSNAIEKFCRENGFDYDGVWQKWGPYGFDATGKLYIDEYYPNALTETYSGVKSYIYIVEAEHGIEQFNEIPCSYMSSALQKVKSCEIIEDAYNAIIQAEKQGLISINRYETLSDNKKAWIKQIMNEQYRECKQQPDYKFFIEAKFKDIL